MKFTHTKKGLLGKIYNSQVASSIKRNHPKPEYSLDEFRDAILAMPLFHTLFETWTHSGHNMDLVPSIDRVDKSLPYTKDNIELMTWKENNIKGRLEKSKPVQQFTLDEEYITAYPSASEASRVTKVNRSHIASCCRYTLNTAGGFKWQFET